MGRGLAGHPRSVRLGSGDYKTRLCNPVHSKTAAVQRRGLHLSAEQERLRLASRGEEFTGKRSRRDGSASSERLGLLQPLLSRPQKGCRPLAHPRSQTPEPCPHEKAVQNDYPEADPLANRPRGLVLFFGSKRCLLSHPGSPPITDDSWDSPSREWHINTRSCPSDCPWVLALLRSTWMQPSPLWGRWESVFWITLMTGSSWPSQRPS